MTQYKIKYHIGKLLFDSISTNTNHAWHTLAVHECINGVDYYYIRAIN